MISRLWALFGQFVIYCIGGGISALANLGITYALTEWLLIWYLYSYAIGTFISILINFYYQRKVTFGVADKITSRLQKFFVVMGLAVAMNFALVYVFTDILGLWYVFSIVVVTFIVAVFNYVGNRIWTFA